ncbi:hypothetical protein [Glycomyces harbinensis]|uniref:Uncharacterized protein n=1 Tax=Glycomyces harbinensis TaxID=58114 RepID=A0A1G7AZZ3_9ACTN|nr:hypothetical protein [Glycomyces harbinensis]SDE20363.1 hypothetical protein SAMN05216270_11547 [Glycomyces harbinensis]
MAPAFDTDTPVLVPDRIDYRGRRRWVLWPVLQYRVVTPLIHDPSVNPFQRAILGLARAGLRDLDEFASHLALEPEFALLVKDELRTLRYLDEHGGITPKGLAALDDGFLDPQRVVVTHVYQDPFTGVLWPAAVPSPLLVGARWVSRERAEVELASAGRSTPITPIAVPVPPGTVFETPSAEEIIEAVSLGSRTATRGTGEGQWHRRAPQRVASRVSLVTTGQPVYAPVAVVLVSGKDDGGDAGASTWLAFSPFSGKSSQMLRHLIVSRGDEFAPLRRTVERLMNRPLEAFFAEFEKLSDQLQQQYEERFEQWFGSSIREHRRLVELLTVLERHCTLARRPGPQSSQAGIAATAAWQIQELLLRQMVLDHPARFPVRGQEELNDWQQLLNVCRHLELGPREYRCIKTKNESRLKLALRHPHKSNVPELLAALVISAAEHGQTHPFRGLAARRPNLLTDLTVASKIRNEAAHGSQGLIHIEQLELSRRLAIETAAAFLRVPVPKDALTTD